MSFSSINTCDVDKGTNLSGERVFLSVEKMQSAVMRHIERLMDGEFSENKEFIAQFCGKDSIASTLVKLCQLQLQLIKVESEIALRAGDELHESQELNEGDWELLARARATRGREEAC